LKVPTCKRHPTVLPIRVGSPLKYPHVTDIRVQPTLLSEFVLMAPFTKSLSGHGVARLSGPGATRWAIILLLKQCVKVDLDSGLLERWASNPIYVRVELMLVFRRAG
jgi:hypothetical protein